MEQNTPKFRLRLNLFDGIVLVIALIAAIVLGWFALHPAPTSRDNTVDGTARYTVRLSRCIEGTSSLVREGDQIIDNTKDQKVGEVVEIQAGPARMMVVDQIERRQVLAPIEGYEEILLTIQTPCSISRYGVTANGSDFALRVGTTAYLRGEGYMGSGIIESLEIVETFEEVG